MKYQMQFIEIIAWITLGFVPTLGLGNIILSRLDKRNETSIPWEI
jgi:hypothetical protein